MTIFGKLCVLMGLALPAVATAGVMNLFSGFKVEREVFVDPGHSQHPLALLRAADGGYFVLEDDYGNGIVKVDKSGQTQWTYHESDLANFLDRKGTAVEFTTAASAPDGGVLIGGHRGKLGEHGVDELGGVLIRLDKGGHVVGRVDPVQHPDQSDQKAQLFDVYAVARWGEGFAVIGSANHKNIIIRLKNDGSILWQRNLVMKGAAQSQREEARAMPNGDLAFLGFDSVVRLSAEGNTLQEVDLNGACAWITYTKPSDQIRFLCKTNDDTPGTIPQLVEIDRAHGDAQITELPHFKEGAGTIGLSQAYDMPDGRYIFFGTTWGDLQRFIPTVVELGADESVIARKEFIGLEEEGITAGMPTGRPDEYVVIRPVLRDRDKARTAMTFLRRH